MASDSSDMSDVEGKTMDHVSDELIRSLDLIVVVDKLLRENLISSEKHEQLASLLTSGLVSNATRIAIAAIKRNPPGYLSTFIAVLRSEQRSEYFGDLVLKEYNTRMESARRVALHDQREASHDQREASHNQRKGSHDQREASHDLTAEQSTSDDRIIDQYVAAIQQHKDKLFDGQRLLAYKSYLTKAGAITAKELMKIEDEHKKNKPKMEAILELLISKRDLQCFIGLSAVMFRYAEAYADVMFPFVDELKDRHPKRGKLTKEKKSSPKHTTNPPATDELQSHSVPHTSAILATPTKLATPTALSTPIPSSFAYRLLWIVDDFSAVRTVLTNEMQVSLSDPIQTDQTTYWETVLFNEVQLYLTYPEAADKIAQTCVHMMERFNPNIALLSGTCTASNKIGHVTLGDVVVATDAVKISSGAEVKDERYRTQNKQTSGRILKNLEVESKKWERNQNLYLEHYKSKIPLRSMSYQRLWYTRLYLELMSEEADRTGWIEQNGWLTTEGFRGANNKKVMEEQMPKLLSNFKNNQIDKKYWERGDGKPFPVKPVHSEMLRYCEQMMAFGENEFPKHGSQDTAVHFATILTTDSNPTADDIDHGNRITNTVIAADLDTFPFYDCVEKYKSCKFFLSVKGVFLMDDGMSDLDQSSSDYAEYARLSSASYALQAVQHLYRTVTIE